MKYKNQQPKLFPNRVSKVKILSNLIVGNRAEPLEFYRQIRVFPVKLEHFFGF